VPISEHIRRLRERVGTELLLVPSAGVLVRDGDGRILLVRHAELGVWSLPGGAVEPDERPLDAAAREACEETGLEIEAGRLLGVFGGPEFRITYPNGDRTAYVSSIFEGRIVGGEARPDGVETSEVAWFEPAGLAERELSGPAGAVLRALL
jgi:ADP-ribose pyrophosphatase YjhB (NUDIX family)